MGVASLKPSHDANQPQRACHWANPALAAHPCTVVFPSPITLVSMINDMLRLKSITNSLSMAHSLTTPSVIGTTCELALSRKAGPSSSSESREDLHGVFESCTSCELV